MTTVVLLGAGGIGAAAARFLGEWPKLGSLIVADRNVDAARAALAGAGCAGEALAADVTDADALHALMSRGDAVLNCVGPYFRFGPPVLAAALRAGKHYLDVCDDWEPTLDMLGQDAAARTAGVTAVIGQGASPGTSNILASVVADAVDEPHSLVTGWSLDDDPGDPDGAANEHWLHQATGLIRVWRDGGYVDEPPLGDVPVAFPGLEPRTALTIGHPEAVTLPGRYPKLHTCLNVMTLPGGLELVLKRAAALIDAGDKPMAASREAFSTYRPGQGPHLPTYPGVWAIADGADGRVAAHIPDYGRMVDMATVTAAPLVAGLTLLLEGKARRTGVMAPEEAFEADAYFERLASIAKVDTPFVEVARGQ